MFWLWNFKSIYSLYKIHLLYFYSIKISLTILYKLQKKFKSSIKKFYFKHYEKIILNLFVLKYSTKINNNQQIIEYFIIITLIKIVSIFQNFYTNILLNIVYNFYFFIQFCRPSKYLTSSALVLYLCLSWSFYPLHTHWQPSYHFQ